MKALSMHYIMHSFQHCSVSFTAKAFLHSEFFFGPEETLVHEAAVDQVCRPEFTFFLVPTKLRGPILPIRAFRSFQVLSSVSLDWLLALH